MTLQEAIDHAREVAIQYNECSGCRKEHNQLADWLEELKTLKNILGENAISKAKNLFNNFNLAISQLHGKCSVCTHYTAYHQQGKCKNCCWDNANPACLKEYQDDNWEWKGLKNE